MPKPAKVKVRVSTQPVVVMEAEVARKIRQHARTSMKAEVCGVLIGNTENERMTVEACIAGINAAQGGAHVTFTQDTWEHIYKIKDKEYPDHKIVGWYHSHPGFGVFLSEHDLFIQQNFFSNPQQVAWVYDPHTDEEGCFGWIGGNIEKLSAIRVGYSQDVEITGSSAQDFEEDEDGALDSMVRTDRDQRPAEPAWMKWTTRVLVSSAAVILGFWCCVLCCGTGDGRQCWSLPADMNHPLEACRAASWMEQRDLQRHCSGRAGSPPTVLINLFTRQASSKLRSRMLLQQKETMANSDDKPALKITLEDLARMELPSAASAGSMASTAVGTKQYGNIAAPADGPAMVTEEKGSIFLQGWFYLGLAGLVGALVGWGICEPFFIDSHTGARWGNIVILPFVVMFTCLGPWSGRKHRRALCEKSHGPWSAWLGAWTGSRIHL